MKLLLILLLSYTLQAAGFWTLTGLQKANIYVVNGVSTLEAKTTLAIKKKMQNSLEKNGIKTKMQDSPTLMVSLEEITDEENHYVYVKLALGEEVKTFRADKSGTFALTYDSSDFIEVESEDLDREILESIDFLLEQFIEHFKDDKE